MAQKTAKTVEDVLRWIEATPHHFASWEEEDGFFILKGRADKLRIPVKIQEQTRGLVSPGGHFDTRMFRANEAGLERLRAADELAAQSPNPAAPEQP